MVCMHVLVGMLLKVHVYVSYSAGKKVKKRTAAIEVYPPGTIVAVTICQPVCVVVRANYPVTVVVYAGGCVVAAAVSFIVAIQIAGEIYTMGAIVTYTG